MKQQNLTSQELELRRKERNEKLWAARRARWAAWKKTSAPSK